MRKNRITALLPIAVFLILFVGVGAVSGDFYSMPAVVGFVIALIVAFMQNRSLSFGEKMAVVAKSAGEENIVTMVLIFISAGAFSGMVKAAGGVDSTVNFGLSILPSGIAVAGVFLIACFISLSMGTSMGTIAALAPIASGIADKTGFPIALCIGAVVCGAMFGDNLSMISDTTIAAVRTQGCEMKDKFKQNFLIVLPAAAITLAILLVRTLGGEFTVTGELSYNLWQILPYVAVLAGALAGLNVFAVLIGGTVLSAVVGIATGQFAPIETFGVLGKGIESMYEISMISLIVAGVVGLVRENGGIAWLIERIRSHIKGPRGAELGIAALASVTDMCTANNTVAIVMAGPIAKEISSEFGVSAKRSASLLDIFTAVWQGIIPYGAQLLTAASLVGVTPFAVMPNLYYPYLMGINALLFILFRSRKRDRQE